MARPSVALKVVALAIAVLALSLAAVPGRFDPARAAAATAPASGAAVSPVIQTAAGMYHSCQIWAGALRCWGDNSRGQLGYGDTDNRGDSAGEMGDDLPSVSLGASAAVGRIALGLFHSCALLTTGAVKCWGDNDHGQLGYGDTVDRREPPASSINLGTNRTATDIVAGALHTCALLDNGSVKCWGSNYWGELGTGTPFGQHAPAAVDLGAGKSAVQIAAGLEHTCAVLNDRTLRCWGHNSGGQLGYGDANNRNAPPAAAVFFGPVRRVLSVAAGSSHTCAVLDDRTVRCWGKNDDGQLGYGDTAPQTLPSAVPVDLGANRTAIQVVAGGEHTCARLNDYAVKCWGDNQWGQLGHGDTDDRGDGAGEMGDSLPTVAFGTHRTAVEITSRGYHTCARLDDGTTKCWGFNADGQLGYGDTDIRGDDAGEMGDDLSPLQLDRRVIALEVARDDVFTCARLSTGAVKCWGAQMFGQLGYGDTDTRGDQPNEMGDNLPTVDLGTNRTALQIAAGLFGVCAVLNDGTVKCWGYNSSGQLGYGDTAHRGDEPNEMGDNLPTVALGAAKTAVQIATGLDHTCAVLNDGTIKCWGGNAYGKLGYGDTDTRGDQPNEMGDNLPAVDLGANKRALSVDVAASHSCAQLNDGTAKCWGDGAFGKLGNGSTATRGEEPNEMGDNLPVVALTGPASAREVSTLGQHTCALVVDGSVACWGRNLHGQLGAGSNADQSSPVAVDLGPNQTARQVGTGDNHSCAVLGSGAVKCWGRNQWGQLGLGDTDTRGDQPNEMGDNLAAVDLGAVGVLGLIAGVRGNCAILPGGALKCWGGGAGGANGLGNTTNRGDEPNEMGANLPPIALVQPPTATWTGGATSPVPSHTTALTLVFSEPIAGLSSADVVNKGTAAGCAFNPAASSGTSIAVTVTCATNGTVDARLNSASVSDANGNAGPALATVADTITLAKPPATAVWTGVPASPSPERTVSYTLAFSDPVNDLAPADFTIGGTAAHCFVHSVAPGAGTTFTVTVGCDGHGTLTIALLANSVATPDGPAPATAVAAPQITIDRPATLNAVSPARLFDTRTGLGGVPVGPRDWASPVLRFRVAGTHGVPTEGASAVSITLTIADPTGDGFATVYPCGTTPHTSNINYVAGQTIANSVTTALFDSGEFCVFVHGRAHVIADISGWFGPAVFQPVRPPTRLIDTRTTPGATRLTVGPGSPLVIYYPQLNAPPEATAVALNITSTQAVAPGYLSVRPCDAQAGTSSLNFRAGQTIANSLVVPLSGGDRHICVWSSATSDFIADVSGFYLRGAFEPLLPNRLFDTRVGQGGVPAQRIGSTTLPLVPLRFRIGGTRGVPTDAKAVALNLTVTDATAAGYATVYPCGELPNTSNVNFAPGDTLANSVTTTLSAEGDFCVAVYGSTHVIADISGWFSD